MQKLKRLMTVVVLAMLFCCFTCQAMASGFTGFLPVRTYNGRQYEARPSSEVTTILLIGYDHYAEGEVTTPAAAHKGGQSDFLLVIVLDHRYDKIHMLQIDRDTMTPIMVMDNNGRQYYRESLQICLSHAYGLTREQNNANTVLAVETLLGIEAPDDGAQIDWYMSMDISGISRLNDLLGGVTITFDADYTDIDPLMTKGNTLTLNGWQAEWFVRGRTGVGDQTNKSRMVRQRQFMAVAGAQLINMIRENPNTATRILDGMGLIYDQSAADAFGPATSGTEAGSSDGYWLMTNALRKTIVNDLLQAVEYELEAPATLPGTHSLDTTGHIRFDPEPGSAVEWALSVLYRGEE